MLLLGAFLITVLCAAGYIHSSRPEVPTLHRSAFGFGTVAIVLLLALGAVWPSIHTVIALPALPALPMFLLGLARPRIATVRWLRWYGVVAVALAPLAYGVQVAWWLLETWQGSPR